MSPSSIILLMFAEWMNVFLDIHLHLMILTDMIYRDHISIVKIKSLSLTSSENSYCHRPWFLCWHWEGILRKQTNTHTLKTADTCLQHILPIKVSSDLWKMKLFFLQFVIWETFWSSSEAGQSVTGNLRLHQLWCRTQTGPGQVMVNGHYRTNNLITSMCIVLG